MRGSLLAQAGYLYLSGCRVSPVWIPKLALERVQTTSEALKAGDFENVENRIRDPFKLSLVAIKKEKTFQSGHAPTLVRFEHNSGLESLHVFKQDDLRPDWAVMNVFQMFNSIWRVSSLPCSTLIFQIIPLGKDFGMMEFVDESISMNDFDFAIEIAKLSQLDLDQFICSAAGSFVATFVLGIRDRHRNNIMICQKDDSIILWQLDFKHVFNHTTTGVDAPRFAIPRAMKNALQLRNKWIPFKFLCAKALVSLRRHSGLLIQLSRYLFRDISSDNNVQNCLISSLFLDRPEDQCVTALFSEIELSVISLKKWAKNTLHNINMRK